MAGSWFWSFAFPVAAFFGALLILLIWLLRRWSRGLLWILGAMLILLGMFMPVMEKLLDLSFASVSFVGWSWYPMIALVLLGSMLVFLWLCRPARESMERKFFL